MKVYFYKHKFIYKHEDDDLWNHRSLFEIETNVDAKHAERLKAAEERKS